MPLKLITAILALIAILLLVAHLEYRFAPTQQAVSTEQVRRALRPCDATISDGQHYSKMPDPRCYFFKSAR